MSEKDIFCFSYRDERNPRNGISSTRRGKLILPRKPVPVNSVWLCGNIEERKKVILVTPLEEIKVEAGILISTEKGKIRCPSQKIKNDALDDLFFPNGDKWWRGALACRLDQKEMIKTILLSLGGIIGLDDIFHCWEVSSENTKSSVEIEGLTISVVDSSLEFSEQVKIGFYLSFGPAYMEKESILYNTDLDIGWVKELYYGHSAYCSGLRDFWENVTGFGASRGARIAINNEAKSNMATCFMSKITGGPGWIETEGNLLSYLRRYYDERVL